MNCPLGSTPVLTVRLGRSSFWIIIAFAIETLNYVSASSQLCRMLQALGAGPSSGSPGMAWDSSTCAVPGPRLLSTSSKEARGSETSHAHREGTACPTAALEGGHHYLQLPGRGVQHSSCRDKNRRGLPSACSASARRADLRHLNGFLPIFLPSHSQLLLPLWPAALCPPSPSAPPCFPSCFLPTKVSLLPHCDAGNITNVCSDCAEYPFVALPCSPMGVAGRKLGLVWVPGLQVPASAKSRCKQGTKGNQTAAVPHSQCHCKAVTGRKARGEESHMAAWSKPRAQSAAAADGLILPKFLYLYCVKMYPEFCVLALCSGFATC